MSILKKNISMRIMIKNCFLYIFSFLFGSLGFISFILSLIFIYHSDKFTDTFNKWNMGLGLISLGLGSIVTLIVSWYLHELFKKTRIRKEWIIQQGLADKAPIVPGLIGFLERLFFTTLIGLEGTKAVAYFIPWVGLKMLTGWNRIKLGEVQYRMLAFNALVGNMLSLLFAFLGGIIILKW